MAELCHFEKIPKIFQRYFEDYKFLWLILIGGFILRLIAALNLGVLADDMHHVIHAINFLDSGRLITYDQSSGLWHCFTNLMYNLFGQGQFTSRIASLTFGTLSIPLIYLLSKEFFSERVSLLSSFLLAISPFHIKNTYAEMDVMAMFFVLGAILFFIKSTKSLKRTDFILAGIFLGLAVYTKVYPLLFILSLLLYSIYIFRKKDKKILTKQNLNFLICFLLPISLFSLPAVTHNYLLFKDKGFMDLQFSKLFIPESEIATNYYSWDPLWSSSHSWKGLFVEELSLLKVLIFILKGDPVILFLGLIGMGLLLSPKKREKQYLFLTLVHLFFALPFLASIILLPKHFLFVVLFLIPPGAYALERILARFNANFKMISLVLIVASLFLLGLPLQGATHFYGRSGVSQMMEFTSKSLPPDSLIISDGRIYTGTANWIFSNHPHLYGSQFIRYLNQQEGSESDSVNITVVYVECVPDDCGWGTIKSQPNFNASMEFLTSLFQQKGMLQKTIIEPNPSQHYLPFLDMPQREFLRVYSTQLQLPPSIFTLANQPKTWFMYNVGYNPEEMQFDHYSPDGVFDKLLDKFAHKVRTLALILALCSIPFVLYITYRSKREKPKTNLNENHLNNYSSIQ